MAEVFEVLIDNVESYWSGKRNFEINYDLLGTGNISEIRFVFGRVVLETMSSGIIEEIDNFVAERCKIKTGEGTNEICQLQLSDPLNSQLSRMEDKRRSLSSLDPGLEKKKIKKQKLVESESIPDQKTSLKKHKLSQKLEDKETTEELELFEKHEGEETSKELHKLSRLFQPPKGD